MPADNRPSLLQRYYPRLARHHYKLLLGSLLLLVLGSGLAPASADPALFAALVLQNLVVGVLVVSGRRRWLLGVCLLVAVALEGAVEVWGWPTVRGLTGVVYSAACLAITVQVFRKLLTSRRVTPELLAAAMCGFVLLGQVGTFLFLGIELVLPGSFAGVGEPAVSVQTLNYFSFTTILTVGFGDIVPVSAVARKAVVLLGLAGHFYDVFVVGVVVGKYVGGTVDDEQEAAREAGDSPAASPPPGPVA